MDNYIETRTQYNTRYAMPIEDQNNPLYGREWRGGKTFEKLTYTIEDIARLTGRTKGTVRNDINKKKIDKHSPDAMMNYVADMLNKRRIGKKIECRQCARIFTVKAWNQVFCGESCVRASLRDRYIREAPAEQMLLAQGKARCILCGYKKWDKCLEWHHLKSENKLFNLSGQIQKSCSEEDIEAEKGKCIVLCCNCHQEIHRGCRDTINQLRGLFSGIATPERIETYESILKRDN